MYLDISNLCIFYPDEAPVTLGIADSFIKKPTIINALYASSLYCAAMFTLVELDKVYKGLVTNVRPSLLYFMSVTLHDLANSSRRVKQFFQLHALIRF